MGIKWCWSRLIFSERHKLKPLETRQKWLVSRAIFWDFGWLEHAKDDCETYFAWNLMGSWENTLLCGTIYSPSYANPSVSIGSSWPIFSSAHFLVLTRLYIWLRLNVLYFWMKLARPINSAWSATTFLLEKADLDAPTTTRPYCWCEGLLEVGPMD